MRLLIDENITVSITELLRERGHEVVLVRDVMAPDTPDPAIARAGNGMGAIIVTFDKDFHGLMARKGKQGDLRFPRLGLILLENIKVQGAARLKSFIELIEKEHELLQSMPGERLWVEILPSLARFKR